MNKIEQLEKENKQLKIDLEYQKKITAEQNIEGCKYVAFLNDELIKKDKQFNANQNQKAIECLKEIKSNFPDRTLAIKINNNFISIWNFIDNKIKELEEKDE